MITAGQLEVAFSERGAAQVANAIRNVGGEMDRAGKSGRGFMQTMFAVAGGNIVANGISAISRGFFDLTGNMISANAEAETWRNSLNIAVGDMAEAGVIFKELQQFAAQTPFEFPELMQAAVRLEGFGVTALDVIDLLGNAAAGMNRDLMQITEAYLDAGVGQYRRLQELGIDVADLGDTVRLRWFENGQMMEKIVADTGEAVQAEVAGIWAKYDGAMETQSQSFQGRMSTFKDNWNLLTQELGRGLFEFASEGLAIANEWFALFGDFRQQGMEPLMAAFAAVQKVTADTFGSTAAARVTRFMDAALVGGRAVVRTFREIVDIAGRLREAIGVNGLSGAFSIAAIELNRFLPDDLTATLISVSQLITNLTGNLASLSSAVVSGDFAGMWESFKSTVTGLVSDGIDVGEIVINGLVSLGDNLADVAGNLWGWITRQIMGGTVGGELALLGATAGGLAGRLGAGVGSGQSHSIPVGTVFLTGAAQLGGALADLKGNLINWIKQQLGIVTITAEGGGTSASGIGVPIGRVDLISNQAEPGGSLKDVVGNVGGWILTKIKEAGAVAVDFGEWVFNVLEPTSGQMFAAGEWIKTTLTALMIEVDNFTDWALNVGIPATIDYVDNLTQGIQDAIQDQITGINLTLDSTDFGAVNLPTEPPQSFHDAGEQTANVLVTLVGGAIKGAFKLLGPETRAAISDFVGGFFSEFDRIMQERPLMMDPARLGTVVEGKSIDDMVDEMLIAPFRLAKDFFLDYVLEIPGLTGFRNGVEGMISGFKTLIDELVAAWEKLPSWLGGPGDAEAAASSPEPWRGSLASRSQPERNQFADFGGGQGGGQGKITEFMQQILADTRQTVGADLAAAVRQANPERTILTPFRQASNNVRPLMAAFEQNVTSRMQGTRLAAAAQMLSLQRSVNAMFQVMVSQAASAMGQFSARINTALAVVAISAQSQAFGIGLAIGQGAAAGVRASAGQLAAEAAAMVNQAIFAARLAALIFSPSARADAEIGQPLGMGAVRGLRKTFPAMESAMAALVSLRPNGGSDLTYASAGGGSARLGSTHTTYQTNYIEGRFASGEDWDRKMQGLAASRARGMAR